MSKHYPLMIANKQIESAGLLEVNAPYDLTLIATVDTANGLAVESALHDAEQLFKDKKNWLSVTQRIEIFERVADIMQQRAENLAFNAAHEGGKPLADSKVEVARAIDGIKNCIECIRNNHGEEIPMGLNAASMNRIAMTHHEPIGVVVAVSAFNHPINLIVHQVGPAIASGCPVIVKPADDTPLSCYELVKLIHQAGLPEAWCQVVSPTDH
ncbi:MAG: aldehyde dehydrogenase family protein, partial [Gammaproteobacteria bacterium]|nr:aldehyde dehydrogenase family protein [Gammaproteobacteria bacterium]